MYCQLSIFLVFIYIFRLVDSLSSSSNLKHQILQAGTHAKTRRLFGLSLFKRPHIFRTINMALNAANYISSNESVHMRLYNNITDSAGTVVSSYVNLADNEIVLACVGGKSKLEIFSMYVHGTNYTENASVYYSEVPYIF